MTSSLSHTHVSDLLLDGVGVGDELTQLGVGGVVGVDVDARVTQHQLRHLEHVAFVQLAGLSENEKRTRKG